MNRVEFVLEGYKPLPDQVVTLLWQRILRANCSGDDPVAVQIALDTIFEWRLSELEMLPGKVASAAEASMTRTYRGIVKEQGEALNKALVSEASAHLRQALPAFERIAARGVLTRGILILTFALCIGLIVGTQAERYRILGLSDRYQQLAARPGAAFWLDLQNANFGIERHLTSLCSSGSPNVRVDEATNRESCTMNLFIQERAPYPGTNGRRLLPGGSWKDWAIGGLSSFTAFLLIVSMRGRCRKHS